MPPPPDNSVTDRTPEDAMKIKVECLPGYREEQEPAAFFLGEQRIGVLDIVDRWYGQDYRYFKVDAADGAIYILRHDEGADSWEMTWFNACR